MNDFGECELTRLVLEAQEGKANMQSVLNACSLFVYRRLQRNPCLDEDVKQDFYLSFLPYLRKMILQFEFKSVAFERYLVMILKKRIKSFFRTRNRQMLLWHIATDASLAPVFSPEEPAAPPSYERLAELLGTKADGRLSSPSARKWFLVWMLKHSRRLEPADIALIARLSGYPEEWVKEKAERLAALVQKQEARLEKLRQRRNRLFVKARVLEMRIKRELDEEAKASLLQDLKKKRTSLRKALQGISRLTLTPSHRLLAEVTGIPKGTVDTVIARLRRLLENRTEQSASFSA
jgi:DNA-directed RNA polymerase specialized sigma24 family protein